MAKHTPSQLLAYPKPQQLDLCAMAVLPYLVWHTRLRDLLEGS